MVEREVSLDSDADAHVLCDGVRGAPVRLPKSRLAFCLPAGANKIALTSRTFVPAEIFAGNFDRRELGLCVGRLQIDGETAAMRRAGKRPSGPGGLCAALDERGGAASRRRADRDPGCHRTWP